MELDYIENVNEFDEHVVRLYNFNKEEALKFKNLIEEVVIKNKQKLNLSHVDFIKKRNCDLILGLFGTDEGIFTPDNEVFYCALTIEGYQTILKLIEPYCIAEKKSYQYLYDLDNPIQFLFAPDGIW